jgi:hypothetical protein
MRANSHELLHGRAAAENRMISDDDMSRQHDIIGEKHVIAEPAIMRDMGLREQSATIADTRRHAPVRRARIDGHAFANDAIGADLERRRFARIFAVLWRMPDRREWENPSTGANRRAACDNDVGDELDPLAQDGVASDLTERANDYAGAERGTALHERQRVHESRGRLRLRIARGAAQGAAFPAASEAPISASQTSTPSTFAFPSNHHMLRF